MSGGGGSGSSNTVTQVQQIPQFEQDFASSNQNLAASIGSQPYPVYQGQLIQGFSPLQEQGQGMAVNAANAYQPDLGKAENAAYLGVTQNAANPNVVASYMSPYIEQALAPQVSDLQLQLAQQQQGINQQATQANAYGDARQGAAQALQNFYGNQAFNQLVGTGYSNAYNTAVGALQNQQNIDLSGASNFANLGAGQQSLGLSGAGAVYNAGQQQQQQGQQDLNAAYQQYLNQVNWPTQMLNIRESALSNSPYNIATATTLPQGNATAQGFGGALNLAGLLGGLAGGGNNNPFGGTAMQTGSKA